MESSSTGRGGAQVGGSGSTVTTMMMTDHHPAPRQQQQHARGGGHHRGDHDQAREANADAQGGGREEDHVADDTGPPWTVEEVTLFYDRLREKGTAWKAIAAELPGRTARMVAALYDRHQGYLALDPNLTSAKALYCIIADREAGMRGLGSTVGEQRAAPQSPSSSNGRRGVQSSQDNVTERKKQQADGKKRPERKRKLFEDSPPSARTRRRSVGSRDSSREKDELPKEEDDDIHRGQGSIGRVRRISTSQALQSASKNSLASVTPITDVLPPKLRAKLASSKHAPTIPTARSTPSRDLKRKRADTRAESSDKIQHTLTNFMKSEGAVKWCMYEWFCADMDRPFFEYNDFQHCLNDVGLGHVSHLTRVEWGRVRGIMGKPRRFSQAFLQGERAKLRDYRANIRQLRKGRSPLSRSFYPPVSEIPPLVPVDAHVIAFHPARHRVSRGTVVAVGDAQYQIEFIDRELNGNLGGIWVADTDVMLHEPCDLQPEFSESESPHTPNRSLGHQNQQEELRGMVTLLRLLLQKEQLIGQLREMNSKAEASAHTESWSEEFQKQYAHIVIGLAEANQLIEPALRRIHGRSPHHSPDANRSLRAAPSNSSFYPANPTHSADAPTSPSRPV